MKTYPKFQPAPQEQYTEEAYEAFLPSESIEVEATNAVSDTQMPLVTIQPPTVQEIVSDQLHGFEWRQKAREARRAKKRARRAARRATRGVS